MCAATAAMADDPAPPQLDVQAILALQDDRTWWAQANIAAYLGVDTQAVQKWRSHALAYIKRDLPVPCTAMLLPEPDEIVDGKPMWLRGTIVRWGMWTGRVAPDGTPGQFKPGRKSRLRPVLPTGSP